MKHGTRGTYQSHGCRCDACRKAASDYQAQRRSLARGRRFLDEDMRMKALVPRSYHGQLSTYCNHQCRCAACTRAACEDARQRKARRAVMSS